MQYTVSTSDGMPPICNVSGSDMDTVSSSDWLIFAMGTKPNSSRVVWRWSCGFSAMFSAEVDDNVVEVEDSVSEAGSGAVKTARNMRKPKSNRVNDMAGNRRTDISA